MYRNFKIFNLLLIFLLILSCHEDGIFEETFSLENKNFISKEKAQLIASQIDFKDLSSKSDKSKKKKISEITSVPNENGEIVYYIINYEENGFLILAADDRIDPVLAFSEESNFPINEEKYPSGLVDWMVQVKNIVTEIRNSKLSQTDTNKNAWSAKTIQIIIAKESRSEHMKAKAEPPGEENPPCVDETEIVGPLLNTKWGQWSGYNDFSPYLNCSSSNGKAPTGCVATAIAQIMRYHLYPLSYNWSAMPYLLGSTATAALMADIGTSVYMDYGCDGSSS